jgi:hypothetical protein
VGWDGVDHSTIQDFLYGRKLDAAAQRLDVCEGNNGFSMVSVYMYDDRKKLKLTGNPAQLLYKLILNCFFGKTIEKPRITQLAVCEVEKNWQAQAEERKRKGESILFHRRHQERLRLPLPRSHRGQDPFHESQGLPHIGSAILSKSKELMERLFAKVEKHAFYTDTDSCHMSLLEWL